jgi:hypothetical protein
VGFDGWGVGGEGGGWEGGRIRREPVGGRGYGYG